MELCAVERCDKRAWTKGLCNYHAILAFYREKTPRREKTARARAAEHLTPIEARPTTALPGRPASDHVVTVQPSPRRWTRGSRPSPRG